MSMFNPYFLLAVVFAILGSFGGGYWKGLNDEEARQQAEVARLNTEARETEQRMAEVAQTYAKTLRKANDVARIKETKLRADLASGDRKLFIPVKAPECPVQAAGDAPASSGNTEARAELDGGVAQALVDLTSRGDQAIRQLNACIDTYEKVRSMK
jgi:prophage endopeptidase